MVHRRIDTDLWLRRFPDVIVGADGDIPAEPINGPAGFVQIQRGRELVAIRDGVSPTEPVFVDLFLWRRSSDDRPTPETRLGGIPFRSVDKPWSINSAGIPYTFVCQFCFADSMDLVWCSLPGDLLTVMFEHQDSFRDGSILTEWNSSVVDDPTTSCPDPSFMVPKLTGEIARFPEYPMLFDAHPDYSFDRGLAVSQSTRIGEVFFFPQENPITHGEQLICVLNHVVPSGEWPFLGPRCEALNDRDEWSGDVMTLCDCGCLLFLMNQAGNLRIVHQSH